MKPIDFKEANKTLSAPNGMSSVLPLRVRSTNSECTSLWRVSMKERLRLLFTGRIWCHVMSFTGTQPPISLSVKKDFITPIQDE